VESDSLTSNLVSRLREASGFGFIDAVPSTQYLLKDAADEIERLTAALAEKESPSFMYSTSFCEKHKNMPWTMTVKASCAPVRTVCPICEPPRPPDETAAVQVEDNHYRAALLVEIVSDTAEKVEKHRETLAEWLLDQDTEDTMVTVHKARR
jgi:hypothetical protein